MNYSLLFKIIEESKLSPELFAKRLGLSGMTLRRWKEEAPDTELDLIYKKALTEAVYQLVLEGNLPAESKFVQQVLEQSETLSFQAAIKNIGFSQEMLKTADQNPESLMVGLSQIGANESKKEEVTKSNKKILSFKKMGREWSSRISTLMNVIRSKKLTKIDKLVAYGGLFYLITIFDLIPDNIPVFGLLDDFSVVGLVAAYYLRKFPQVLPKANE